jgi:hypothetical protein
VNGRAVPVLFNGVFRVNLDVKAGRNEFVITTTDKHGAQSSITKTFVCQSSAACPKPTTAHTPIALAPTTQ